MNYVNKMLLGLGVLGIIGLSGCATTPTECQPPSCDPKIEAAPLAASAKYGQAQQSNNAAAPANLPADRVVYFDFDISDVRADQRQILDTNAAYLAKNQQVKIRLEGHADERGSREYNLALGERRAQAVKRYLGLSGVQETQMSTLSYGEEKPVAEGHDEASWQRNRRVEIIYLGQ
ncbi:MAG: peptidoglycan-associated lipoprotein Pal [Pseudomonadota bacterium]|jgi:peptidoglycan-associated lipoprotein